MTAHVQTQADTGPSPSTRPAGLADPAESATERLRLDAVRRYDVLDSPPDGAFDRVTALAARHFGVPIAIVSIVDTDRIWFKSRHGLEVEQIDRDPGLCASAILQEAPWIVEDATLDPRTFANPLVAGEFGLQFYAGAPLTTSDGFNLGTLCVIDHQPRRFSEEETASLVDMAGIVTDELEIRLASRRQAAAEAARRLDAGERHLHELQGASLQALLSAVEACDSSTASHSLSVVDLARAVGEAMYLPAAALTELSQVALLHDVGKIGISADILRHPGLLDDEAWDRVRQHTLISERIVAPLEGLAHLGPAVRAAHERWDGGGYPDGLEGEAIPIASRIVFACDGYDAMTTDRPYRRASSPADAQAELRAQSGSQFDPEVVEHLIAVLGDAIVPSRQR